MTNKKESNKKNQRAFRNNNPYYSGYNSYKRRHKLNCEKDPSYQDEHPLIEFEEYCELKRKGVPLKGKGNFLSRYS